MEKVDRYDSLLLKNQLCFPLYAAAKEVVKRYRPYLDEIDLTYTQYIVMMVIWEKENVTVKELGETLFLDSGTLTPVLKCLEQKGFIQRERNAEDERVLDVTLTEKGRELRERALSVPQQMASCVRLTKSEAGELYRILYKLLRSGDPEGDETRE